MIQVVPLRYDTAFKKAFSQPAIFCQFVHDVLGIDLQIEKVYRGYKYLKPVGQVDIEYDLFAEDEKARIVVEIQHIKERDFFDRFLYYHLISMVEQVKSSRNYRFERTVYTVVVLTGPPGENGLDCSEIDETRYNSPAFQQVIEAIKEDNISPEELRRIIDERVWDEALKEDFEKGRREGREEGLREGLEEGLREGHERGLQEGLRQGKEQIALSLLREGADVDLVARTTGLNREEIEKLRL
ncbi:PD-(D/E)XK nuclease family transposase [Candidatus Poribacteria bacterium]|nr:PD-(D/E)XK nuclease family transposase [Candidatus Poribacteria bacterium]